MNDPQATTGARQTPLPGLAIAVGVAAAAWLIVALLAHLPEPLGALPLSMMLVAILAGLALSGVAAKKAEWTPGLSLARGPILKLAVALIGLRLSLTELGRLGVDALPLVIAVVLFGLVITFALARMLATPGRLATLLAVGTSICGASAIAATAPGLRARSEEVGYAIACVALFGLAATLIYPAILAGLFDDPHAVGLVLGVAIHDTAQVTAAAVLHEQVTDSEGTLVAATVAKLIRNAGMLVLIPAIVWLANRGRDGDRASVAVPLFIIAFVLLSGVRSLGDALFGADQAAWSLFIEMAGQFSLFAFAMAMAALAMAVRPHELTSIGWKPALAALVAAAGMFGLALAWLA